MLPADAAYWAWILGVREGGHLTEVGMAPQTQRGRRVLFWFGVILMVLSFGIYLAYPAVPFLPISGWARGGVAVGMSAVSWGMFLVGSVLAGKEGVAYLKRRFSRRADD